MSSRPTCSVILVNWNGREFLGPCLAALQQQTFSDFETVMVDNASTDGSADWVAVNYPGVHLLHSERNVGFPAGCNAGIAAAQGEFLVLLNNDTEASPTFLEELVHTARLDERVGMVAGVLVFARQPGWINSAGITMHWDGTALDYAANQPLESLPSAPVEIFGPSGGAALYRRAMLEEVGALRSDFFAYLEDADLAWRGRLAGWEGLLAPRAVARHAYSATSGRGSSFKSFQMARNRLLLLYLDLPAGLWLRYGACILAYDLAAGAYGLLRDRAVVRGRLAALRMFPALRADRRAVQKLRRVPLSALARWMERPLGPGEVVRMRRRIAALAEGEGRQGDKVTG